MNLKNFAFLLSAILILRQEAAFAELRTIEEKNAAGIMTKQKVYENEKLMEERLFNGTSGALGTWLRYQYPGPGRVIKTNISVVKEENMRILSQEEWTGLNLKNESTPQAVLIRSWVYSTSAPYELEYIAVYDKEKKSRIQAKQYLNEKNQLKSTIIFTYQEGREKPVSFIEKDPAGQILSKFSLYEKFDVPARLRELGKSTAEVEVLTAQRENPEKVLVAIIDTGFDYNHADLVTKWWNNPEDPIDGIDNDGNGWVDDNFGWDQVANQHLPSEAIISFARDQRPLSHGTHVAAIAAHGLSNIGLIGFGGEYTDVAYMDKVSAFIKKHNVKVVNMSLGIPLDHKDQLGLKASVRAYQRMIESNPNTLFVVAAGNELKNLDVFTNRQYPASFMQPNVLKVGALDVGSLEQINEKTKMAYFSNWGKNSIDILAPGWEVMAAGLGGGLIAHSGTSMASPYMVNQVVQLWSELPHLTAKEVRELFIATAHKMSPEPEIRSGGYVDLKAALRLGRQKLLEGQKAQLTGPNCWNSATYLAGISAGTHYTNESEFRYLMESPLCKQVPANETRAGDIIALRRYSANGKVLPAPFMSEVHGYTDLGDGTGFTKNGQDKNAGYEIQKKSDIFAMYKASEFKNCKIIGLNTKDCVMKEVAYRCQTLSEYFSGKLNPLENEVLVRTLALEKELGDYFMIGKAIQGDKQARIADLQHQLEQLSQQGSSKAFTNTLSFRLSSLASQF